MLTRVTVFPRLKHLPEGASYAARSYCIGAEVDAALVARILGDAVLDTVSISTGATALPDELSTLPFTTAVDVHFAPGVTDNPGATAKEALLAAGAIAADTPVYSGVLYLEADEVAARRRFNALIEVGLVSDRETILRDGLSPFGAAVSITGGTGALSVDLSVSDEQLIEIARLGIPDENGTPRGPLGLNLEDMQAVAAHYRTLGRNPSDIELETIAQSWSEHCKHRIFAGELDEISDGLFKHCIARATEEILARPEKEGFCLSVFGDNAGAIAFDDEWMVSDKVETHNSPSALDPFGGAMTGIVGVNRDCLGFGLGAKPVANRYGFCVARPDDSSELYRDPALTSKLLSGQAIAEGVIEGVEAGGNQSGIPTVHGFVLHDDRYRGKPLVFCGTIGLLPRQVADDQDGTRPAEQKSAEPGDRIVVVGGAVGQDGIHGATFSSVALDSDSPATAVQIGDPITQKRLTDALLRELRPLGLYRAITDNGAGGLSSSVGEMAESAGGARVNLDQSPLKYPGLSPWEIWISESQERMTLAVAPQHVERVLETFRKRGVLAADIGEFTDSGNLDLCFNGVTLGSLSMAFLHKGAPRKIMKSAALPADSAPAADLTADVAALSAIQAADPNLASRNDLALLYDHEVQSTSVIKPLQGIGRIAGDASVIAPVPASPKAVALSSALLPHLTERNPRAAALLAIDQTIRQLVAVGADPAQLALQDNFCWCSAEEPDRLAQLKAAALGCYEGAVHFGAPYISGKDSMFNDFKGYAADGSPLNVSALPTLLISGMGIVDDRAHCQTMDFKAAGDQLILVGTPGDALGGSLFEVSQRATWQAPDDMTLTDMAVLETVHRLLSEGKLASVTSVGKGGLLHALRRSAMAGRLGAQLNADLSPAQLVSEYGAQFLLSVDPRFAGDVAAAFADSHVLGAVTDNPLLATGSESISLEAAQ